MKDDNVNISSLIYELNQNGFLKTVDSINEYSNDADLYYRKIDSHQYLIFNHYNKKHKANLQGFDCWVSTYKLEMEIGKKKAIQTNSVQLSFQIDRDWGLITQYL
jgi:hypothetical protein